MSDLVFDAPGSRYWETGISKGAFFPHTGGAYAWDGLTGVDITPQAGETEEFWFDGVKTMERNKPIKFQATIRAVNTPRDFDICEGVNQVIPGMKSHFNQRIRFNLVWMSRIGNDESETYAFKLHIVYNALTAPSNRTYETVTDISTPENRSIQISAMPCGSTPYYTFDSRDADLTVLLNSIYSGVLPPCEGLAAMVGIIIPDEEIECVNLVTTFQEYNPGQILDEDIENDTEKSEITIYGEINNGFDVVELPILGAVIEDNDSESLPTVVGTGDILNDGDDATYVTSLEGDLGYTIPIPNLTGGNVLGARLELRIRMSIDGGVNPDDPDRLDAEAQVHISTDTEGELTIGGFSDGAQEGMAFKLTDVIGTPVDYVIPLKMDSWVNSSVSAVIAALKDGAYLNILGASNFNSDPALLPVTVRVYEAKIVMINSSDGDRYLRMNQTDTNGYILNYIWNSGHSDYEEGAFTAYVDFKIKDVPLNVDYEGVQADVMYFSGNVPGSLKLWMSDENLPTLSWRDEDSIDPDVSIEIKYETWYRVRFYWTWAIANIKVWERDA